jgi:hypothetical protein
MIKRWIISLILISSLKLIAADPITRILGDVTADKNTNGLITEKKAYKDFLKKYKEQKITPQEVDFNKEFIYLETYCCSSHTRWGSLNLKVMDDGIMLKIQGFPTNKMGCNQLGEMARLYVIEKGKINELIDHRNRSYTLK